MYRSFSKTVTNEAAALLVAGTALLAAALLMGAVIAPQISAGRERFAAAAELRRLASAGNNHEALRTRLQTDRGRLMAVRAAFTGGMAENGDISAVLHMLIEQGRAAGVHFARIQPQPERIEKGLSLYPVLLEATADYHALGALVASMEELPYLLRIDRLAINPASAGTVSVNIMVTCFLKQETVSP